MAITNSVTGTMKYLTIGNNTYEITGSSSSGDGTVTSVGISNATNGGLTISGSPITSSGNITVGHSNVLTNAQTTSAIYPIKIDKNGHISEYGSAVSIPTKVSDLTNDSGFVTTDEKLKTSALSQNTTVYHPILTTSETSAENKKYSNCLRAAYVDSNYNNYYLQIGNGVGIKGSLKLSNTGSTGSFTTFSPSGTTSRTLTLPDKTGTVALTSDIPTVPTKVSDLTNDSGYLTSYTETDPTVPSWAKASTKPSYTASLVGAAASDHIHGNITNGGDITATAPTVANGDQIIINDNSASKITNGPTFDGSTTTKALTPKGTWETFSQTDENVKVTPVSSGVNYYPTFIDTSNTTTGTLKSNNYFKYSIDSSASYIDLGNASLKGKIRLSNTTSGNTVTFTKILPSGTADRTITLPDASGTVALTSNIPTVPTNISSFTNDSGYTTNTGTVTSVGLSNATNGGLTISGSPVTSSGSITVGHSNVLSSAQTTQALYPIKIDKNGHISAYGTAITSLPASDVSSWAKASSKPSYTASEVGAAASSHTHGNITNAGDITASAPTIASGDKIIINDLSASKITNGPSFGTSTTTFLRNDGTWVAPKEWTLAGSTTNTGTVTISDTTATEVCAVVKPYSVTAYSNVTTISSLEGVETWVLGGYYLSTSDYGLCNLNISNNGRTFQLRNVRYGGSDRKSNSTLLIYYR